MSVHYLIQKIENIFVSLTFYVFVDELNTILKHNILNTNDNECNIKLFGNAKDFDLLELDVWHYWATFTNSIFSIIIHFLRKGFHKYKL